jgi:hypothetical protein
MSDAPQEIDPERQLIYATYRDEIAKRQLSNVENFDKSILTYASAGLAFSLGFLKDFIPVARAAQLWMLYGSWICFTTAIGLVIASYPLSQTVLKLQLDRAYRYYCENQESALGETIKYEKVTEKLATASGIVFLLALILTTIFVIFNLGRSDMSTTKPTLTQDGAIGLSMQKAPTANQNVQKGATGLPLQQVAPKAPQQPPPATTGTGSTGQ